MDDDREFAALAALSRLTPQAVDEVLALLCKHRPEAVLAAVQAYERHRAVLARLTSPRAPD